MSGLWSRIGTAFERTDIGAAGDGLRGMEEPVRSTNTRYAPIRNAVERRVSSFLRDDLVSHLEIGPNELFVLHYIEIAPDKQGEAELEQFMHEFSPESRVFWVKKLLGGAVGQHVSVDQFLGLDREFKAEQLAETDPYEEALNQSVIPPYRVILHGRWEAKKEKPVAISAASIPANDPAESSGTHPEELRAPGPQLRLSVQDAKEPDPGNWAGIRVIEIDSYPAVLGTSAEADVEISGYYVSARHCTLHWESRQLWLVDHSTNGTWVDGEKLRHGARVALANGAVISFGRDRGESDCDRYPVIRAQIMRKTGATGLVPTPIAPSRATPVVPLASASPAFAPGAPNGPAPVTTAKKPPLAVISIVDASGSPRRDVLTVPYTIGRGSAQDYVVPDANQGVSREHLVIEAVDATGALTLNRAVSKNGTSSDSGALPERFTWRFGQEIVLGEKWSSSPPVRLTLQPVEDQS
jgi:pSer/pThr/pTyr-binding forkhead associated (FHA) protein